MRHGTTAESARMQTTLPHANPKEQDGSDLWVRSFRKCESREEMTGVLRELLDSGTLQVGYRLPSIRKLQEISGLRQHDVYRALETLATEGRIEQRRGSGTFVLGAQRRQGSNGHGTLRIGVVPPSWDPGVSHHAVAMFLTGITEQADLHHSIQLVSARVLEQNPMAFVEHVRSLGLEGIIWIKPPVAPPPAMVCLLAAGVPVVVVGRTYAHLPVVSADYDHAAMGGAIADFMIQKGRKKLLCMAGVRNDHLMVGQLAAIRGALQERGLDLPDDQIVTVRIASAANVYSTDLRESVMQFFRQHEDFDAVYSVYSDQFDVLTSLHESGHRRCPEDFIHIHQGSCNLWAGQQWPPFPTALLSAPSEAVGRLAVKKLELLLGVHEQLEPENVSPHIEFDPY